MSRKGVIAAVAIVLALPVMLSAFEAISFHIRNRNNGFLISSGRKREYLLYVPRSYDPAKPAPLVISMHGAGGWPTQQMALTEWNRLAESGRFIVVYPSGLAGVRISSPFSRRITSRFPASSSKGCDMSTRFAVIRNSLCKD